MVYYITLLLFSSSLSLSPTLCGSVEYYVTSTSPPNTDCPQPCYTLDYYALNTTLLSNKENVSLLFLEGLHTLNHDLEISGIKTMCLTQFHSMSEVDCDSMSEIIVNSDNHRHIRFENITYLKISNLCIYYGYVELSPYYGGLPPTWLIFKVHTVLLEHLFVQGFRLELEGNIGLNRCMLNNSTVHIICSKDTPNVATSLTLYNADILDSRIESSSHCKNIKLTINGSRILRSPSRNLEDYQRTITFDIGPEANLHVDIVHTRIDGQLLLTGRQENNNISLYIHRSRIMILDPDSSFSTVSINVDNTARNNKVCGHITDSKINDIYLILDVTFTNIIELLIVNTSMYNTFYVGTLSVYGYLFTMVTEIYTKSSLENETVINITIENCTFINNRRASVIKVELNVWIRLEMLISDSIFNGNQNPINLNNQAWQSRISSRLLISLRNVTFENNFPQLFTSGVIRLFNVNMLNIQDCKFINNQGTAIKSYNSRVTLAGDTLFSNNNSTRGGALFLYESFLYLAMNSSTSFFNNYAQEVGGAIYVKQRPHFDLNVLNNPPCFYQTCLLFVSPEMNLTFKSNFASGGGDDIYGGSLYTPCRLFNTHRNKFATSLRIFHFQDKTLSSVASDPTRVCLCDDQGTPQCASMKYIYRKLPPRYPGEVFTVPAVVVGYGLGTVPGVVFSELVGNSENLSIGQNQRVQEIKNHRACTKLNFSIESQITDTKHTIQLNVGQNAKAQDKLLLSFAIDSYKKRKIIEDVLLNHPVLIDIPLQNCPIGFTLTTTPPYICTCHPTLEDNGITVCIITNHTGWVYRSGTVWVSASFSEKETNTFVVHQYCPYDYCKPENISVDLKLPDTQCAFNHSGVLCGGCYGNLSLALGTSRCLPCDNRYVSLLIVFLFAGLVLVFFIKVLDLTVAKGTINGLIFYANIVWANKSILFPTTETLHPAQQILHTFIAWLNLDLGSWSRDMFY